MRWLNELSAFLGDFTWPDFFALFLLAAVLSPVWWLVLVLARKFTRVQVIKVGDLELTEVDVKTELMKREALKMAVLIALSDVDVEPQERTLLNQLATERGKDLSKLDVVERESLLHEGIWIAAADGEVLMEEYAALRLRAEQYKVECSELDRMVVDVCIEAKAIPPQPLREALTAKTRSVGMKANWLQERAAQA